MKRLFGNLVSIFGCLLLASMLAQAAQLKEAHVTQVVSDVKLLPEQAAPRPAAINDPVRNGTAVRTGTQSRSELTFTDLTITRLGANTIFSFKEGTRTMNLGEGAILFQVPKGAGGATIKTAAITAAITGTTGIGEYHRATTENPKPVIKWFCLEGHIVLSLTNGSGQTVELEAGQMIVSDGTYLPKPVFFDIATLVKSSLFFLGFETQLASWDLIQQEIQKQLDLKIAGGSVDSTLVAYSDLTTLTSKIDQALNAESPSSTETPSPTETPTPTPTITPTPSGTPSKTGTPSVITSSTPYVITSDTTITTDPTITTNARTDYGKIYRGSVADGPLSAFLFGSTTGIDLVIDSDPDLVLSSRGLAVFKFAFLELAGDPTISTAGGPDNLVLVGVNGITSGGPGGVLHFSGIQELLLATQNGSISLGSEISFAGLRRIYFYARGANSILNLASDVTTTEKIKLWGQGGINLSSNLSSQELIAFTNRDFNFTAGSIDAQMIVITADRNLSFSLGSPLRFEVGEFELSAGRNLHVNDSLEITSDFNITLLAGGNISIDGDLSLTTDPTGVNGGRNIIVRSDGNTTIGGALSLLVTNSNAADLTGTGNITLAVGGNLTADSVDAVIDSGGGGSIDSAVTASLRAGSMTIGGNLFAGISNDAAGSMESAALTVNTTGNLTTGGSLELRIGNTGFNDSGFVGGGDIASDAVINLNAANISAGSSLQVFILNDGGGHIGGDALINSAISGNLGAQSSVFFDIENAADTNGESLVPGGTIDGNAAVSVAIHGNVTTPDLLEFAVLNNDFRFLSAGGTITGDATVDVSAGSISAGNFFQPLINNTNGIIGGEATVTVNVTGATNVGTQGYFRIINDGGSIGGNALFTFISGGNVSIGDTLFAEIQNRDGGEIGGNAKLTFTTNNLSVTNTGNFQILSGPSGNGSFGGQIGGDATINVNAANITVPVLAGNIDNTVGSIGGDAIIDFAVTGNINTTVAGFGIFNSSAEVEGTPGSISGEAAINLSTGGNLVTNVLVGFIDNRNGGSIGSNATINVTVGGNATIATDATFEIDGSDGAESAGININGGNYDAGGTFRTFIDGDGVIAFNNASVHADVLKVGALGTNGVLNIGGGTLSADTELKLYASGSNGQLNFISNVTLGGNSSKILAANSVTIFNNVVVTIGGANAADVYTNQANYTGSGGNNSTTGTFAGAGANQPQPLPSAPPFDDSARARANAHSRTPSTTNSKRSGGGENVVKNSRTTGRVINVSDSGQLLALLDGVAPGGGGKIAIPTARGRGSRRNSGRMNLAGRLDADRSAVNFRTERLLPAARLP